MAASRSLNITYVPADCGSIIPGKSKAPKAFQHVNIVNKLRNAGISSISEHDALETPARWAVSSSEPNGARKEELNVVVCQRVLHTIGQNLNAPANTQPVFQLIIGGECSMLPGILTAFWQHAQSQAPPLRVGLVYIDADTDLSSPLDSDSSGTFAGMNMTNLLRSRGALQSMSQFSRPTGEPVCDPSNTIFFGTNMSLSGNKREHLAYLFDNNFKVVSSSSVARDPELCATEALQHLEEKVDIIVVHLDVDSIDPQMFPLANVPNFTGVTFEQMMRALEVFLGSSKVGALTVAEVNPDHDPELHMIEQLTDHLVAMLAARKAY